MRLGQFLSSLIADGIGHRRAIMELKRRAERGDAAKALAILSRAPDIDPLPGDERL